MSWWSGRQRGRGPGRWLFPRTRPRSWGRRARCRSRPTSPPARPRIAVPDGLRQAAGISGRADRGAALHTRAPGSLQAAAGIVRASRDAPRRARHLPAARGRIHRRAPDPPRVVRRPASARAASSRPRAAAPGSSPSARPRPASSRPSPARASPRVDRPVHHAPASVSVVDALITNFHLPRSSLLLLVTAFVQAGMPDAPRSRPATRCWRPIARRSSGVSVLFVRGRDAHPLGMRRPVSSPVPRPSRFPRHHDRVGPASGRCRRPTGRSTRRSSCRSAPQATVKALDPTTCETAGAQIILGNTYHLSLRPGDERIARLGGLHAFMGWAGRSSPIRAASRSSASASCGRSTTTASPSRSHLDGSPHAAHPRARHRDPGGARQRHRDGLRRAVGADAPAAGVAEAMARTHRWAERCLARPHAGRPGAVRDHPGRGRSRAARARRGASRACRSTGSRIGGLRSARARPRWRGALERGRAGPGRRPRPRYLMGVGSPDDFLRRSSAGSTSSTACLPTRVRATGSSGRASGRLNLGTRASSTTRAPPDPDAPAGRVAITREPTLRTCSGPRSCSPIGSPRSTTSPILTTSCGGSAGASTTVVTGRCATPFRANRGPGRGPATTGNEPIRPLPTLRRLERPFGRSEIPMGNRDRPQPPGEAQGKGQDAKGPAAVARYEPTTVEVIKQSASHATSPTGG